MSTVGEQGGAPPGASRPAGRDTAPAGTATQRVPMPNRSGGSGAPQARRGSGAAPRQQRPRAGASAPRHVKLTVSRVDPWSVMKIAFLLSVALGIAGVVLVAVIWTLLSGMGVFASLNSIITDLTKNEASTTTFDLMNYLGFGRLVSLSVVIGVIDIILVTALATVGAFLYNICASLVGGLQLTLSDD